MDKKKDISGLISRSNYPEWVFHILQTKMDLQFSLQDCNTHTNVHRDKVNKTDNIYMVIPYSKGLSENFRKICSKAGVHVHFGE